MWERFFFNVFDSPVTTYSVIFNSGPVLYFQHVLLLLMLLLFLFLQRILFFAFSSVSTNLNLALKGIFSPKLRSHFILMYLQFKSHSFHCLLSWHIAGAISWRQQVFEIWGKAMAENTYLGLKFYSSWVLNSELYLFCIFNILNN